MCLSELMLRHTALAKVTKLKMCTNQQPYATVLPLLFLRGSVRADVLNPRPEQLARVPDLLPPACVSVATACV